MSGPLNPVELAARIRQEKEGTQSNPGQSAVRIEPNLEDFQNPRKIFSHLDRIHELQTTGDTRPVHMTIGLTNYCNHKCSWCYINWHQAGRASERSGSGDIKRKAINADWRLIEAVGEARQLGLKAVTIVGDGEPTMHKRFIEVLEKLSSYGLDIGIFTNFSATNPAITEALAKYCYFVRGSIDAATAEVHKQSHGVDDFDTVINNMRRLIELRGDKKRPAIGAQFVTNQWNYTQLPYAARFFRDLGIDYMTIKPAYKNVLNPAHPENEIDNRVVFPLMREAQSYSTDKFKVYAKYPQFLEVVDYKTNDGRYYKKCNATPLSPYLDEDGNVEMCGNLKGRGFTLGNIYKNSFEEIWHSQQRKDCLAKIDLFKCPSGCKLDPLNKVLWDSFNPDADRIHPNFI
jgi:radical SAM protein with 4Fe4S-binding SPASM domain